MPDQALAGIGEELFYRGYAIERLQALGLSRFWAAIPVLIFFSRTFHQGLAEHHRRADRRFYFGGVLFPRRFIGVVIPRFFS